MKSSEKVEEKQKPLELRGHREEEELLSRPLLTSSHQYFNVLSQLLLPLSLPTTPLYSPFTHTCRSPRQIKAETRDACGCFTSKAHRHVKAPLHFLLFPFFQCHLTNDWTWQFFRRNSVTAGPWLPYYSTNKRGDEETIWVGKKKHGRSRVYSNNILTECVASLHLFSN